MHALSGLRARGESPQTPERPARHRMKGFPWARRRMGRSARLSTVQFEASLEGGEDAERIEGVAPLDDLAILDARHGDVPVAVRAPGPDDPSRGGVFEHDRGGCLRVVHAQIVAAVE